MICTHQLKILYLPQIGLSLLFLSKKKAGKVVRHGQLLFFKIKKFKKNKSQFDFI